MQKRIRQFSRSKQPDADIRDKVINRRAICKRGIDQIKAGASDRPPPWAAGSFLLRLYASVSRRN
jgi:hypothetical protein